MIRLFSFIPIITFVACAVSSSQPTNTHDGIGLLALSELKDTIYVLNYDNDSGIQLIHSKSLSLNCVKSFGSKMYFITEFFNGEGKILSTLFEGDKEFGRLSSDVPCNQYSICSNRKLIVLDSTDLVECMDADSLYTLHCYRDTKLTDRFSISILGDSVSFSGITRDDRGIIAVPDLFPKSPSAKKGHHKIKLIDLEKRSMKTIDTIYTRTVGDTSFFPESISFTGSESLEYVTCYHPSDNDEITITVHSYSLKTNRITLSDYTFRGDIWNLEIVYRRIGDKQFFILDGRLFEADDNNKLRVIFSPEKYRLVEFI